MHLGGPEGIQVLHATPHIPTICLRILWSLTGDSSAEGEHHSDRTSHLPNTIHERRQLTWSMHNERPSKPEVPLDEHEASKPEPPLKAWLLPKDIPAPSPCYPPEKGRKVSFRDNYSSFAVVQ